MTTTNTTIGQHALDQHTLKINNQPSSNIANYICLDVLIQSFIHLIIAAKEEWAVLMGDYTSSPR